MTHFLKVLDNIVYTITFSVDIMYQYFCSKIYAYSHQVEFLKGYKDYTLMLI